VGIRSYSRHVTRWTRDLFVLTCAVVALVSCGESQSPAPSPPTAQQQESTATSAAPADGTVRYLALGDSLSQGVGAPDEQTGAFPALLAERWRAEGCEVELQNAGISGYTAGQVLDEQVPKIDEFNPTLITFQAGGNDLVNGISADEYRSNVAAVLDAAAGSGARVIVLAQNEWFRAPSGQGYTTPEARDEFDSILIEEAESRGAEFVDMRTLYKQQADENQWVEDGIHPTPEAYEAWAAELSGAVSAPCR
jgi:acyl-CoA thioesterase I